jgi:hypothetical protein
MRIGNAEIFLGDCLKILPELPAVDVLITDPVWPNCPTGLLPGHENPFQLFQNTVDLIKKPKRMVIVLRGDSDPRFLCAIPKDIVFFRSVLLPYALPGYIGRKLGGDEVAYCFGEPVKSTPGRRVIPGRATVAQPTDRKNNNHPCSRALPHFKWLVNWFSEPGETILDPFMGSGTTGIAALHSGRKFIGIEIVENYFNIAKQLIADEDNRLKLF